MPNVHRLPAVLAARDSGDHLCHDRTRDLETLRALDQFPIHHRTIFQHVPDVDQTAVEDRLYEVIHIVEMQHAFLMCLYDLFRQEDTLCQIL